MDYALRDGLSYCLVKGSPIFLDAKADRYFMVQPGFAQAFPAGPGHESHFDPDAHHALLTAGIIKANQMGDISPCAVLPLSGDIEADSRHSTNVALTLELVARQTLAAWQVKHLGFNCVLQSLRRKRSALPPGAASIYPNALAGSLRQAHRWRDSHDNCLARGIAVFETLMSRRVACNLVIGVQLPFAAHCWVQKDSILLTDRLDRVADFTPILMI